MVKLSRIIKTVAVAFGALIISIGFVYLRKTAKVKRGEKGE